MAAMAEAFGTRPSELLGVGIGDPWAAFCFDEALFVRRRLWLADRQPDGRARFRPDGYEAPAKDALRVIPWGGDGPDPLKGNGS